jgi:hypothetical protein
MDMQHERIAVGPQLGDDEWSQSAPSARWLTRRYGTGGRALPR